MKSKVKISRSRKRDLVQPDEFITTSSKVVTYFITHKKVFIIGLCAVLLAGAGLFLYRYFSEVSENKVFFALNEARTKYEEALKENPEKAYEAVKEDFKKLQDDYSGTNGGKMANLLYANICYKAGKLDEAIDYYNRSLAQFEGDENIAPLVLSGLGYAYKDKEAYDNALSCFEKVVSSPIHSLVEEAYFNMGLIYEKMNNPEKSKQAFKSIIDKVKEPQYIEIIKQKIAG